MQFTSTICVTVCRIDLPSFVNFLLKTYLKLKVKVDLIKMRTVFNSLLDI